MPSHQIRWWLAATLGLNGSALLANGNGKHLLQGVPGPGLVVPSAVMHKKSTILSPHLLKLSLPAWLSGTMSTMRLRASILISSLLEAASWCTGSAHAVQEGSLTAGQHRHTAAYQWATGVQFVLVTKLVSATHWSPCFRPLRLNLMWIKMALHLLR